MKTFINLLPIMAALLFVTPSRGQVQISDGECKKDTNSTLELGSANHPNPTFADALSVFNMSDGSVLGFQPRAGFKRESHSMRFDDNEVTYKSASATLLKTETEVQASNNIVLTLPLITSEDDGLCITIKNIGTYTDLVTVLGNEGATINGKASSEHTRWVVMSYIADGGNWVVENAVAHPDNEYRVSSTGSWTTVSEVLEYLKLHMTASSVVRVESAFFTLSTIQTLDLPFPVTFVCSIIPQSSIPNEFILTSQR